MSALDKSLDEILSSKPKKQFKKKPAAAGKNKVGKLVSKKAVNSKSPASATPLKKGTGVLDASYATKVVVHGLPRDIKQDAIKDFFASEIGGVYSASLSYNEKGVSKGIATVSFKSSVNASKAVEKYNGVALDDGHRLKLELIIDPTKKPLAARIVANTINTNASAKGKKAAPVAAKAKKPVAKKAGAKPAKAKRPAKKSIEELDQEMTDYFDKK